jgi:hypothetical protein
MNTTKLNVVALTTQEIVTTEGGSYWSRFLDAFKSSCYPLF